MATTSTTTPALFRFSIHNTTTTTHLSHTHPVPLFLCQPASSSQPASSALTSAFIDVLSLITAQHHDECMHALTTSPCLACSSPSTDCLKSPTSFLNLVEPLVVVNVYPVCADAMCASKVRAQLLRLQTRGVQAARVDEANIYGKMMCQVCGGGDAKRCAGCGTVGYCSKECQREGWKAHKRDCGRRHKGEAKAVNLPYETI